MTNAAIAIVPRHIAKAATIPAEQDRARREFQIERDNQQFLTAVAERVRARMRRTTQDLIDTGKDLIAAKKRLGHGAFTKWLESEFAWTDRTAQRLMRAAECFDGVSDTVSVLPAKTIYLLSAKNTPENVTKKVVEQLESGAKVDPRKIESDVRQERELHRRAEQKRNTRKARNRRRARGETEQPQEITPGGNIGDQGLDPDLAAKVMPILSKLTISDLQTLIDIFRPNQNPGAGFQIWQAIIQARTSVGGE